ncbi:ATP-binding protein [Sphingobacterium faecium]|uniref:HAMP domain-containing sensor histidine kinase n=1 Tax=Sphingobacterium faecium TaxID=34087 RepID=UPI0004E5F86A|nr:ATP-binding protein [Sphingobacterium faecium]UXD67888.1 ATP-binding protein [Sphingobacterium faecium]CDS92320.1 Two-component sensor histidine kinase [Sphingobacterium sp. PM2-P1-29]
MHIKTKLTFGVGSLFLMIVLLVVVSGWYVNQLKRDTNNILVANYNTLQYARNMLLALEEYTVDPAAIHDFKENLEKQKQNVTEIGEVQATDQVERHFYQFVKNKEDVTLLSKIRKDITELMRLNMEAIERKSDIASITAEKAIAVISISGTLCFLIAFVLIINLPSNIANPIKELTESIKQIANENYKKRIHYEKRNEFGELANSFNTMAEKLEEYAESKLDKILKGKKRIDTLINKMHDPVIGIDEQKIVLFANEEALKIIGLQSDQLIGKQIQDVAVTNDLVRDFIKDLFQEEKKRESALLKIYANGKESYFEKEIVDIDIVPTGETDSQFIGQVIMLRNITQFKEMDFAKTNFIATISHELKTPIASIKMGLQLLENKQIGVLNDDQSNLVQSIRDDTGRLLKITGELLNMTQVESGTIQLNVAPTNVSELVEYAIRATKSMAEQKHLELRLQMENNLPDVLADNEKTAWVLTNLLSNAVRYSYENSAIFIIVESTQDKVRFAVKDAGQGIEEQYMDKIFERYFRIPGTKKEGTGLGLSISKEFIEAQGGTITVQSEYGSGSVFSFTLNRTDVDNPRMGS